MAALLPSANVLPEQPGMDLSSRLEPIQAHHLKNGAWVLDDNTGLPGTVSDLKMSKTGKHGHAKYTYKLSIAFSGRSSSPMHPGGDRLLRPVMAKREYEVMDYITDESELTVLDGDEERKLFLDASSKLGIDIAQAIDNGKVVVVTCLEGPQKIKDRTIMIEMPQSFKQSDD